MSQRSIIVLTGGSGGGKTTLIEELTRDPTWANRFVALPEAIFATRFLNIPPREKLFRRVMVNLQMGMKDAFHRRTARKNRRMPFASTACCNKCGGVTHDTFALTTRDVTG